MAQNKKVAIVVGGSVSGLLTAVALVRSEAFSSVKVLDRDPSAYERHSITQAGFVHVLTAGGIDAVEELLPGFKAECVAKGGRICNTAKEAQFRMQGNWLKRVSDTELDVISLKREQLELAIRERAATLCPNIEVRFGTKVTSIDYDSRRVEYESVGGERGELTGDLLVLATGRIYLKLIEPLITKTLESQINLGYACVELNLTKQLTTEPFDLIETPWAGERRGSICQRLGGNKMLALLVGYHDDCPKDVHSISEWWARIPPETREFLEARGAQAVSDRPKIHIHPRIERRFFVDKPCVLVVGDAACSVDPAFGQGMTKAALEAREVYRRLVAGKSIRQCDLTFAADTPHVLTTCEGSGHPLFKGYAPFGSSFMRAFNNMVFQVSAYDAKVSLAFQKVIHLRASPALLVVYLPRILATFIMLKLGLIHPPALPRW